MFLPEQGYKSVGGMRVRDPLAVPRYSTFGEMPLDEEEDYIGSGGAAPIAPAPAPAVAPKQPSALDSYAAVLQKRPSVGDPALKPRPIERVLGGLAGAGMGFAEGYLNTGRRGQVVPSGTGASVASSIVNRRYNRANERWQDEAAKAKGAADIEAQKKQRESADLDATSKRENIQSQIEDRRERAKDRDEERALRGLQREATIGQMGGVEVTADNPMPAAKAGEQAEWETFRVGDKTYRRLTPYGKAKQSKQGEQEGYMEVPPDVAAMFKHPAGKKVPPAQYQSMLTTYANVLDKRAAREQNDDLRRDLAKQSDDTRRAIASMAAATRTASQSGAADERQFRKADQQGKRFASMPEVKMYNDIAPFIEGIRQHAKSANNPASQISILYNFIKSMDSGSVVKEGEVALVREGESLVSNAQRAYNKILQGGSVSPKLLGDVVSAAETTFKTVEGRYKNKARQFRQVVRSNGLDEEIVFGKSRSEIDAELADAPKPNGGGSGGGKQLNADTAKQYLQKAGGDKNKARELARADGYTF